MPLAVVGAAMVLVWAVGWHKQLTLENIAANRDALQYAIAQHRGLAVLAYVAMYVAVAGLSLPGATILTLTGGLLFGWLGGGVAAVVGATAGATIVFLIARTALGETLAHRAGPLLGKLRDGFKHNALSYVLFLRLVPAFPFWLVNLAPALRGVPLGTYVLGTFIGIIPGTLAIASVGAGLDAIIAAAEGEYAACITAKDAAACSLAINAGALVNKQLIAALVLLGAVALIPVVWRKRKSTDT